jgi:hypothetical protein
LTIAEQLALAFESSALTNFKGIPAHPFKRKAMRKWPAFEEFGRLVTMKDFGLKLAIFTGFLR